jgi:catechol 2,3-dioxygenase-like lactoylglutathione lyase family enzyme
MEVTGLNHVALLVASVEESVRFYGGKLGLAPLQRPAFAFAGAWFRIGPAQELHLIGGRIAPPAGEGSRGGHFALQVADIAAAARRLEAAGIPFRGPAARPDGAMQVFLQDPDGHTVELCAAAGGGGRA